MLKFEHPLKVDCGKPGTAPLMFFSAVLDNLTKRKEKWLQKRLERVLVYKGKIYTKMPAKNKNDVGDWHGPRFIAEEFVDNLSCLRSGLIPWMPLKMQFGTCPEFGRYLWIYVEGLAFDANVLCMVGVLVKQYLAKFDPGKTWKMTFARVCAGPAVDGYTGGVVVATAKSAKVYMATKFVENLDETKDG